jgi:hypothetical protein
LQTSGVFLPQVQELDAKLSAVSPPYDRVIYGDHAGLVRETHLKRQLCAWSERVITFKPATGKRELADQILAAILRDTGNNLTP